MILCLWCGSPLRQSPEDEPDLVWLDEYRGSAKCHSSYVIDGSDEHPHFALTPGWEVDNTLMTVIVTALTALILNSGRPLDEVHPKHWAVELGEATAIALHKARNLEAER